jgi:hypothetical protein
MEQLPRSVETVTLVMEPVEGFDESAATWAQLDHGFVGPTLPSLLDLAVVIPSLSLRSLAQGSAP